MNEVQGSAKDAENTLCSKIDLRFELKTRAVLFLEWRMDATVRS